MNEYDDTITHNYDATYKFDDGRTCVKHYNGITEKTLYHYAEIYSSFSKSTFVGAEIVD